MVVHEVPLVDAATVIVLREAVDGFEVFLVRRHHKSGFMANVYVYPGGKLDASDCTERAAAHVRGLSAVDACARLNIDEPSYLGLGLFLAGVRETFEESGILLACRAGCEDWIDLTSDPEVAERFAGYRRALITGELSMTELAERENLVISLENIGYFAHWITPYIEKRRFDTRFFVTLLPPNQRPLHDAVETTDSLWIRPQDALERYFSGTLLLAPPTIRTLEQLAEFPGAQAVLDASKVHNPPAILPHIFEREGISTMVMPGDAEYPADDPNYAVGTPVLDGVTRMQLLEGRWKSIRA